MAFKPAKNTTDPLVQFLFDEMNRQGVSARQIEERTVGAVDEHTILQWRSRAVPTITNLRLCLQALDVHLAVVGVRGTEIVS